MTGTQIILHLIIYTVFIASINTTTCPLRNTKNGRWSLPCVPLIGRSCKFTCYYNIGQPPSWQPLVSLTLRCDTNSKWSPEPVCPTIDSNDQRLKRQTVTTVGNQPRPKPQPQPQVQPTRPPSPPPPPLTPQPPPPAPFCPNLNPPASGFITGKCVKAGPGDVCIHSCKGNFILLGPPQVACTDKLTWSTNQPMCAPADCPALPPTDAPYIGPTCSTTGGLNGVTFCIVSCPNKPMPVTCWGKKWIPSPPPKCAAPVGEKQAVKPPEGKPVEKPGGGKETADPSKGQKETADPPKGQKETAGQAKPPAMPTFTIPVCLTVKS